MFLRLFWFLMNYDISCVMMFSSFEFGRGVRSLGFEGIFGLVYLFKGEFVINCKGDDVYLLDIC